MRSPLFLVFGPALGFSSPFSQPASAFRDCMATGRLADFTDASTAEDVIWVEPFRLSVPTPDSPREVRAIAAVASERATPPDLAAEVERGARLAGIAFAGPGR